MNTEKLTKDQKRHARDRARAAEKERFDREMGRMPTEIPAEQLIEDTGVLTQ